MINLSVYKSFFNLCSLLTGITSLDFHFCFHLTLLCYIVSPLASLEIARPSEVERICLGKISRLLYYHHHITKGSWRMCFHYTFNFICTYNRNLINIKTCKKHYRRATLINTRIIFISKKNIHNHV